jgi:hypothetical protein
MRGEGIEPLFVSLSADDLKLISVAVAYWAATDAGSGDAAAALDLLTRIKDSANG